MKMLRNVAAVAVMMAFAGSAQAVTYSIVDLGVLPGGTTALGFGVNNAGQVTGYGASAAGARAFSWADGTMTNLGTLSGSSYGQAINGGGVVAGYAGSSSGYNHAAVFSNGTVQDLGTLGGTASIAYGINDAGQVTGYGYTAGNNAYHAARWTGGVATDLGTLGGLISLGRAINASGQVAGGADNAANQQRAALWTGTTALDLGTLGGTTSVAYALNDIGQVAGYAATASGQSHAFLATAGGGMIDLGTLGGTASYAYGINASGDVVGNSTNAGGAARAMIYSGGVMSDLNSLLMPGSANWTLSRAQDINDSGQITGYGSIGGQTHAFLMSITGGVPEPSSWAMMLTGFGFVGATLRRRRAFAAA